MLFKEQGNIKIHRTCDTSIRGWLQLGHGAQVEGCYGIVGSITRSQPRPIWLATLEGSAWPCVYRRVPTQNISIVAKNLGPNQLWCHIMLRPNHPKSSCISEPEVRRPSACSSIQCTHIKKGAI
jgi:hypothetical protein